MNPYDKVNNSEKNQECCYKIAPEGLESDSLSPRFEAWILQRQDSRGSNQFYGVQAEYPTTIDVLCITIYQIGDRTKWYWTKWYGQNGKEKMSRTKW